MMYMIRGDYRGAGRVGFDRGGGCCGYCGSGRQANGISTHNRANTHKPSCPNPHTPPPTHNNANNPQQRHAEVPRLTPAHYEAMALFNELAASDALRLDHMLQPGEIQLLSNHTQLHTRAAFEDYDDVDLRRHLLRLWLAPEGERPLPDSYREIYGGEVAPGRRGGIRVEGTVEHISLEAA